MKTCISAVVILLATLFGPCLHAATSLGTINLVEGSAAGMDSIVLSTTGAWTATTNAPWLHLSAANQSGTGSTNVFFSFDINRGATRSGTLTIAGQTLTITQAGSTYVAAGPLTALVSSGLSEPTGVAVDGAGNVYVADGGHGTVKKWSAASNTVTTLVSSGLSVPIGMAVDSAGNVYIADTFVNVIDKWSVANSNVTALVSSGLNGPYGVALDRAGNVFIADTSDSVIKEWSVANSNVTTVVSGLDAPGSVAVDAADNLYIPDVGNGAIEESSVTNGSPGILASGLSEPAGLAVDNSGNVYITSEIGTTVQEWVAASQTVTTLISSGVQDPWDVAVDGAGNVYVSDIASNAVFELPRAFVDPTARIESPLAGHDVLPIVLPASENLSGPFAPTNDQPWLAVTGVTNGVVSYSFTQNTGAPRTAHINLLGESIPVIQDQMGVATRLTAARVLQNGGFELGFTNLPGAYFTVLSTTNMSLPLSQWVPIGMPRESPPGHYQFADTAPTNAARFYILASP
jgi:Putative binding domain, N-terminal/NHL repeat